VRLLCALNVRRPVDPISQRLAASAKHWERPEPLVSTENLVDVVDSPHVIGAAIRFPLLVQVLNSSFVG